MTSSKMARQPSSGSTKCSSKWLRLRGFYGNAYCDNVKEANTWAVLQLVNSNCSTSHLGVDTDAQALLQRARGYQGSKETLR